MYGLSLQTILPTRQQINSKTNTHADDGQTVGEDHKQTQRQRHSQTHRRTMFSRMFCTTLTLCSVQNIFFLNRNSVNTDDRWQKDVSSVHMALHGDFVTSQRTDVTWQTRIQWRCPPWPQSEHGREGVIIVTCDRLDWSIRCFFGLFIYFLGVVFQLLPLLRFRVIYSSLRTTSIDSLWCVDLWQRPSLTFCCTEFTGQGLLWIPRVCWSWHRGHDWSCDPACRTPASQWRCLKCWSCSSPRLFECVRGARPGSAVPRGQVLHFHSPSVGLISHELFTTSSLSLLPCVPFSVYVDHVSRDQRPDISQSFRR